MMGLFRRAVSRTDAPTLGFKDTLKRRRVSPRQTQREADLSAAEGRGRRRSQNGSRTD